MSRMSSVDISDVVGAPVDSSTPMPNDITVPEVDPSESVASHSPVAHDKNPRQIAIYNDDFKFCCIST